MPRIAAITLSIFAILLTVVMGAVGANCHYVKKEQAEYTVGPWRPKTCPFPFYLDVQMKTHAEKEQIWSAAMSIHREVGGPLGYGPIFMPAENLSTRKSVFVVPVRPPHPHEKQKGGICGEMFPRAIMEMGDGLLLGALRYEVHIDTETLHKAEIILCTDRIALLNSIKDKFMKVQKRPMDFYAKHELMHLLVGGGHPTWGCGITCADPQFSKVTQTELSIIKRTYDPLCRAKTPQRGDE